MRADERDKATPCFFSAKALLEACAPVQYVLKVFMAGKSGPKETCVSLEDSLTSNGGDSVDENDENFHWKRQQLFFEFVAPYISGTKEHETSEKEHIFLLPRQYAQSLVSKFMSISEEEGDVIDHDGLLTLYYNISLKSESKPSFTSVQGYPDPNEKGYLTFRVPYSFQKSQQDEESLKKCTEIVIPIRVFPHHNDVGVQRVWEAGAALAEFLLEEPHIIRDKRILEVGAGVGFTGLVAQICCQPKTVALSDFSQATLDNINHNSHLNMKLHGVNKFDNFSVAHLDWRHFNGFSWDVASEVASGELPISQHARQLLVESEVLLAADVLYDPSDVPLAVNLLKFFLSPPRQNETDELCAPSKIVIIAYTVRNATTFNLFLDEIKRCNISSECISRDKIDNLPFLFPCYFRQPRSDVQIFFLTQ